MSLEHLVPITEYVPTIYKDVREIDVLCEVEDNVFNTATEILKQEGSRMCIQTSDEKGVRKYERVYRITANPAIESLDFRKERLLTRSNINLPYSTIWLRNYLNAVIGEHNYELQIDYDNLVIRLYGYLLNYNWAREFSNVIRSTKPCNIIFINIPTIIENLGIQYWWDDNTWNSDIWNDINIWNDYKVLTSEEIPNYTKETDEEKINTLCGQINSARLNNNIEVSDITKSIKEGTIIINFNVPQNIKLLEYIEIIDIQGGLLFSTPCYIDTPIGTTIEIRLSYYSKENIQ